ncbi:MAG: cell envelope integrity protein TolA [Gammaproteobacteria bacterium]
MKSAYNQVIIYNGYPLSVVVAITLHCLVLAMLLFVQNNNSAEALDLVQPAIIKALFIDENPQVVNAQRMERQRIERQEQQRLEREREQQRQRDAEAARQQEAEAEAARQRQLARERSELLQRQELERLQAEQQRLERERAAEQQRQRDLAEAERQRQLAQERLRQQEAQQTQQLEAARTEFELVQSATALIQQFVQENWSRPPSARNGMRTVLRITMLPTGEVTDVSIVQSSNDPAFDRSAERAVYSAEPFTELRDLPIRLFNANFRSLTLVFQPEDLLN